MKALFYKVKGFFTLKKYSIIRFCLVIGAIVWSLIIWLDGNSCFSNWGDYVLFPVMSFLIGTILYAFSSVVADNFCKDKPQDFYTRYITDNFDINDLRKIIEILYQNEDITKDLYLINNYFLKSEPDYGVLYQSQGENFPPHNALSEENKAKRIKFLNELKNFVNELIRSKE